MCWRGSEEHTARAVGARGCILCAGGRGQCTLCARGREGCAVMCCVLFRMLEVLEKVG
jgi:hypothetical protein